MAEKENNNFKEVTNNEAQEVENTTTEQTPDNKVDEVKQNWVIKKWNKLKFWQKVLVVLILTGTVVCSFKVIFSLIKKDPQAVSDAIDVVTDNPELVENVVDLTNENLVETVAQAM